MFKRLILGIFVFGMLALAPPAEAMAICDDRQAIVDHLATEFSESLKAIGLQSGEKLFEIWSSDAKGSWTIVMTNAEGRSCIMASGWSFETNFPDKPSKIDPSS